MKFVGPSPPIRFDTNWPGKRANNSRPAHDLNELKAAGFTRVQSSRSTSCRGGVGQKNRRREPQDSRSESCPGKTVAEQPAGSGAGPQALARTFPGPDRDGGGPGGPRSPVPKDRDLSNLQPAVARPLPTPAGLLGTVEGKPAKEEAIEAVKKANPASVVLMPFMFVAGEHVANDILGDAPESWKSELLKQKNYRIDGSQGLGYLEGW